jgi:hypothetical protein
MQRRRYSADEKSRPAAIAPEGQGKIADGMLEVALAMGSVQRLGTAEGAGDVGCEQPCPTIRSGREARPNLHQIQDLPLMDAAGAPSPERLLQFHPERLDPFTEVHDLASPLQAVLNDRQLVLCAGVRNRRPARKVPRYGPADHVAVSLNTFIAWRVVPD